MSYVMLVFAGACFASKHDQALGIFFLSMSFLLRRRRRPTTYDPEDPANRGC